MIRSNKMFVVCGEALFDFFVEPADAAASPSHLHYQAIAGGSPFNVAISLRRLGLDSALFSGLSNDFLGNQLRRVLEHEEVDTTYLVPFDAPTTLSLVGLDAHGHPQYSFYGGQGPECSLTQAQLPEFGEHVQGIHLGSYVLVKSPTAETLQALIARESERRLITLDPNLRLTVDPDIERWRQCIEACARHAHIIKTSDEDLARLYPERSPEEIAAGWLKNRCCLVILTRGGDGVTAFSRAHGARTVPAQKVNVVDTVGAGDTFQAGLLCYLSEHGLATPQAVAALGAEQIEAMLHFAAAAAALTCSRRGPDLPRRHELV
jgi:fructokinase